MQKGCRKKHTRQSRKLLWLVLSSPFFNEICKNGTRGHVLIFTIANIKESNKIKFDSYSVRNSVLIISHITFSRLSRAHFFNNLSRNSCMQQSVLTTKFKIKSFNSSCFMH